MSKRLQSDAFQQTRVYRSVLATRSISVERHAVLYLSHKHVFKVQLTQLSLKEQSELGDLGL